MIHFRFLTFAIAVFCAFRIEAAPVALPLIVDFELNDGGFIPSSDTSWKWGPPTAGPGAANSGTQVWGTNLTSSSYSTSEDAVLKSGPIDLSSAAGQAIVIRWSQHLITEEGFDFGLVEVSKDSGGTWEAILGPRSGEVDAVWTRHVVTLDPSYATEAFLIRFRLVSDDVASEGGFFVDDLGITAAPLTFAVPLQDFEASDGGYVASGTNSSWAYGTPVSAPGSAFSGGSAWATNLDGLYNADEDSALTSPSFDLSAFTGKLLIVSWRQFFDTEAGYDFAQVEISNDSGASWTSAGTQESGPVNIAGWTRRQVLVDSSYATSGFRFRFRLKADSSFQFDGWAIDDVAVFATSALFPTVSDFTKSTAPNTSIVFTKADFTARYVDPDGGVLAGIKVLQLPANGSLQLGLTPVTIGQTIPVESLATLTYVPLPDTSGAETFVWSATNFYGSSTTATVNLSVLTPSPVVVIVADPEAQAVNPGDLVTFRVTAISSLPLTYQWRKNLDPIPNANGSTFSLTAAETDEADYDVVVTNTADEATSAAAALSVNDPVSFIQHPGATTVNENAEATFTVQAAGTGRLDYQWMKGNQPIPDATFATLVIDEADLTDAGSYSCIVTNVVGPEPSNVAVLTVRPAPRIQTHPISVGRLVNRGVTLSVEANGAGTLTYQWLKDGEEIPGATSSELVLLKLLDLNSGQYSVRVSNDFATTESDAARLSVFRWKSVAGVYQDVLELGDAELLGTTPFSGRVTATISGNGRITGVLEYRGFRHSFLGTIDESLIIERVIRRGARSPLTIRLELDVETKTLATTVVHDEAGDEFRSTALLPRNAYHTSRNAAPQAGRYNVVLSPENEPGAPFAPGYVLAIIKKSGRVTYQIGLPNSRVMTGSAVVDPFGRIPFYAGFSRVPPPLGGELAGRLGVLGDGDARVITGEAGWREPQATPFTFLPAPFSAKMNAEGSIYTNPLPGETVLLLPPGSDFLELLMDGPIPGAPIERVVRVLDPRKFVVDPETIEKLRFRANLATGLVTATYFDSTSNTRRVIKGVTLQTQGEIRGFVRSETNAGEFVLAPLLP